jgi:transcriptional regulator with XRE-family HTH domain
MMTRIRDVRRAKGLTLAEVAMRCRPPTTAQTIGRLETGMRTVSMGWLNRIADALEVDAAELVTLPERADIDVVALLGADGPEVPTQPLSIAPPSPAAGQAAVRVDASQGEYRAGDLLWLDRVGPDHFVRSVNRDVLAPRPVGRFAFGRLLAAEHGKLHILPMAAGQRQLVITDPAWIGVVRTIIRPV